MPNGAHADHLKRWDMAIAAGEANPEEPGTTDLLAQLFGAAEGLRGCIARRNLLRYQLQQNSRDLDGFLSRGKELFSRVVHVVKGRYGWKSEKLAEWGLQPQRPTVTPKLPPPETVQSTDQAAHSQTDSAQ